MSWFGDGFTNLRGQLTTFTRDVLHDVVESVQGRDEDSEEERAIEPSTEFLQDEIQRLQARNKELELLLEQNVRTKDLNKKLFLLLPLTTDMLIERTITEKVVTKITF